MCSFERHPGQVNTASMTSSSDYYSYSKQNAFRCVEKWFRYSQSALLLYMVFCFIFYMITVGIDIAKLSDNLVYLLISLSLDTVAMGFIVIGVRGVALEVWALVIMFDLAIIIVAIGHGVTFCFRHIGLNTANFIFDVVLVVLAKYYTILLYRFEKLKPADYDVRQRMNGDAGESDELTGLDITGNRTSGAETGMELSDVNIETTTTNA